VVANGAVRCLVLPAPEVQRFLIGHPPLMFRMLQVQARRLKSANAWRG
jgi:CRP-like cAMP-binding protein